MICICGNPLMLHFGYALSIRSEFQQRPHEALKKRDHHDFASRSVFLLLCTFRYRDLLLRQSIQLADQRVYLPVGGLDLPLPSRLLVRRAGQGRCLCRASI